MAPSVFRTTMSDPHLSRDGAEPKVSNFFRSVRRRIIGSIAVFSGGLVALLLYFAFLGTRFTWYQNLAVGLSFLIAIPSIIAGMWVFWGLRAADRWIGRWSSDRGTDW
jgi:hypothetical protein